MYEPTVWVNDKSPDIDEDNLNKIEQGIKDAHDMAEKNAENIAAMAGNQMPEEYLKAAVDEYVNNNSAGFATQVSMEELESQLTDQIESATSSLNSEISDEVNRSIYEDSLLNQRADLLEEQVNTLNEGGLNLKEDFIGEQIQGWLNEHPEATTTVQDNSLEVIKFTNDAKKHIVKDYVTPEMFGAKGDGVTDDTESVKNAISVAIERKKPIILCNDYKITSIIHINANDFVFRLYGSFVVSDNITVLEMSGNHNDYFINKIKSYVSTNILVKVYCDESITDTAITAYNRFTINNLHGGYVGLQLFADGTKGVQYNSFKFGMIYCEKAIEFYCGDNGNPWIAHNQFYDGRLRGAYGLTTRKGVNQIDKFNDNNFYNVGFEGISDIAIDLHFAKSMNFENIRLANGENSFNYAIYLDNCNRISLNGNCDFSLNKVFDNTTYSLDIQHLNPTLISNYLDISTILVGTDTFCGTKAYICYGQAYVLDCVTTSVTNGYNQNIDYSGMKYIKDNFVINAGGDANTTCVYKLSKLHKIFEIPLFINVTYKNNTCNISVVDDEDNVIMSNESLVSGAKYKIQYQKHFNKWITQETTW